MNNLEFKKLVNDYSDLVYQKYYTSIPKSSWTIKDFGNGSFAFGYRGGEYFRYNDPQNNKISFSINNEGMLIQLAINRHNSEDEKNFPGAFDMLKKLLQERNLNALIHIGHGFGKSISQPKGKYPFLPIGEKAKNALNLLDEVESAGLKVNCWTTIHAQTMDYGAKRYFYIYPKLNGNKEVLEFYGSYNKKDYLGEFSTKEEIHTFVSSVLSERAFLRGKEDEIVEIVKKTDITSYYNRENGSLYIYNERVAFYISEIFEKGKKKFRIRFDNSYNKGTDIEKVMEKVKTKVSKYIKTKRVKAAVSGGAFDVYQKFVFKVLGHQVNGIDFKKMFHSHLSEGELNLELRKVIDSDIEKVSNETLAYYQTYLRSVGKRHRIKSAAKLGPIYAFVSASKIFVHTEEHFDSLVIRHQAFRTKPEQEKAFKMQENKEKSKVI